MDWLPPMAAAGSDWSGYSGAGSASAFVSDAATPYDRVVGNATLCSRTGPAPRRSSARLGRSNVKRPGPGSEPKEPAHYQVGPRGPSRCEDRALERRRGGFSRRRAIDRIRGPCKGGVGQHLRIRDLLSEGACGARGAQSPDGGGDHHRRLEGGVVQGRKGASRGCALASTSRFGDSAHPAPRLISSCGLT